MPDEVHFDRDEIDRLHAIAAEARDALVDRVRAEFSDDKAAEALCFALAILAASGFAPGLFNALFFGGMGRVSLKCHTPTQTAL